MDKLTVIIIIAVPIIIGIAVLQRVSGKIRLRQKNLNQIFSEVWREILRKRVVFYAQLKESDRILFEKRVQRFLATKKIEGIDTEVDDTIRLLVASSAVIPTFAFPNYNYPNVRTILIYPNSFDEKFQTQENNRDKEPIIGMVNGRSQNSTVILSKPDLIMSFDGLPHKTNVGIHEFVHLLDKEDGVIDGIPELLLDHQYVGPWLHEIKKEINKIEKGKSDINPYALTNNAEFLAVVSEYFFDSPEKFQRRHPELYQFLSAIYDRGKNIQINT